MRLSSGAARVVVAVIAIPVILAACVAGSIYFTIFAGLIGLVSFWEFANMVKNKGMNINVIPGYLFILILLINSYKPFIHDYFSLFLAFIIISSMWELFRNRGSAINNLGGLLLGALYIGLGSASLINIREFPGQDYYINGIIIVATFISIWVCDSAAYYGGTALGKHKLFPRVSPNKSWEGSLFGFFAAIITLIVFKLLGLNINWLTAIGIGLISGIIGQIGDLIESLFKRDAGVKDSSGIIPGHGGIFDRFDSLLLSAPVIFLYLKILERFF